MSRYNKLKNGSYKYFDKVRNKSGFVVLEYDGKLLLDRMMASLDWNTRKDVVEYVGMMLKQTVEPYIPRDTGELAKKGSFLHTAVRGIHAEVDLRYRNVKSVPYVFYQYYGRVWGPNYAVFEQQKFDPKNLKMSNSPAKHTGWVSPKGKGSKYPTHYVLGEKRTIHLRDGRVIHIDGYTNPQSHAMWLEYVRNTPTIWVPFTRRVTSEIREVFADALATSSNRLPTLAKVRELIREYGRS